VVGAETAGDETWMMRAPARAPVFLSRTWTVNAVTCLVTSPS